MMAAWTAASMYVFVLFLVVMGVAFALIIMMVVFVARVMMIMVTAMVFIFLFDHVCYSSACCCTTLRSEFTCSSANL